MVHVHIGKNTGNSQGVGDVGFAAASQLAKVRLFGEIVGALYLIALLWIEITAQGGSEGINGLHIAIV